MFEILERKIGLAGLRPGRWLLMAAAIAASPASGQPIIEGGASYRQVFVTSTSGTGDLRSWDEITSKDPSGTEAADEICQVRAEAAGLAVAGVPEFVAWISNSTTDAYCRVQGLTGTKPSCGGGVLPGAGPWVRTDGLLWGEDLETLTGPEPAGGPYVQIDRDELGNPQPDESFVSGTSEVGVLTADGDCNDWESASAGDAWDGSLTNSVSGWSGGARSGCQSTSLRLLCLERGTGDTPPRRAVPGALVFVTSTSCAGALGACTAEVGDSGVDAADNICVARATAGHLPSPDSFFAWISVTGLPAGAHLTGTGPWKRVDGYPVAATPAAWKDGYLDAVLFIDELGQQALSSTAWTGTSTLGNATGVDCQGWMSNQSGHDGTEGWPERSHDYWTSQNSTADCNVPRRLYCLSNQVVIFWNDFEPGGFDPDWSAGSVGLP